EASQVESTTLKSQKSTVPSSISTCTRPLAGTCSSEAPFPPTHRSPWSRMSTSFRATNAGTAWSVSQPVNPITASIPHARISPPLVPQPRDVARGRNPSERLVGRADEPQRVAFADLDLHEVDPEPGQAAGEGLGETGQTPRRRVHGHLDQAVAARGS